MTIGEYGSGIMDTKQTQISIGVYKTQTNIVVQGTHTPRLDFPLGPNFFDCNEDFLGGITRKPPSLKGPCLFCKTPCLEAGG